MYCFAKNVAMAFKRSLVVSASGLLFLLGVGCLASSSLTPSKAQSTGVDSPTGTAGRGVLECPGVCPACPGCPDCPNPPPCQRPIPPGYKKYDDDFGYYKINYGAENWYDAKESCEKTGGYLAVLNSEEEAQMVSRILENYNYTSYIHIGFYDVLKNQTYLTVLGDLLSTSGYVKWGPGEPSHPGTALCGAYYSKGLYDEECTFVHGFLCELFP